MSETNNYRYIAYVRKSTESEERQVMSHEAQIKTIKQRFPDLNIVKWMDPESQSAFKPGRPIFQEMVDLLDAGKADAIVAWHPDRISRNEVDASAVTYRIRQGIIKDLKFASGMGFENTPEGMMMLQMTMSQSQYYSAKLSKDVKRGVSVKATNGGIMGVPPEGFMKLDKKVVPDPIRHPLIRQAFDLFLTGEHSLNSVLTVLNNDWNYRTIKRDKVGGKPLTKSSIYRIFRNKKYMGIVNDPYTGEEYEAEFPPMISEAEYNRVQQLLNGKGKPRLTERKEFPLRGLIKCGECNCMITAETKHKKLANGGVNHHTYYHCTKRSKTIDCQQKGVKEAELYQMLDELLDQYELSPELYEWGMQALDEIADKEIKQRNSSQGMTDEAKRNLQREMDNLLKLARKGFITPEKYDEERKLIQAELDAITEEQVDQDYRIKNWYEIVGNTLKLFTNVKEDFAIADINTKREILLAIGKNPVLIDQQLLLEENDWLIPIKNKARSMRLELDEVRTAPQQIREAAQDSICSTWLGMRDSNPRSRNQNPLPYHLANPQCTCRIIQNYGGFG